VGMFHVEINDTCSNRDAFKDKTNYAMRLWLLSFLRLITAGTIVKE
jgi:hypothetical protein